MTNVFTLFEKEKYNILSFLVMIVFISFSNLSNAQVLSVSVTGTNPTCGNYTDGSAEAVATGGWPGYTYVWSTGQSGPILLGVGAGTYTVTVTDIDDVTATGTVTLTAPPPVNATATLTGDPCAATRGATVTASGGSGNYSYLWDNGSTNVSVTGLSAGIHCATVTDANGCAATACVTVSNPLTLDVTTVDSQCGGICDGSASANVSGGTAPYTYSWSNGGNTPTIAPLPKGTYTVTVTDANGCQIVGTGIVDEPDPVVLTITTVNPTCAAGSTGSISVSAVGGVTPYTYLWNTGANTSSISNLPAGSYTVIVTDANNCAQDTTITLTGGGSLGLVASATDVSCGATNDGSASATASGGVPPYTYSWSNGMTGANISGLTVGSYIVTATDADGCSASFTVSVGGGGTAISVSASGSDVSCPGANDGSATATASGGVGTLTYTWSNGMTGSSISGLGAGTYTVNVSDGGNCSGSATVTIAAPPSINLTASATDENCPGTNDGTATASATGGNGTFTYNWSNGGFGPSINNLAPGSYTVTATDINGCTATQTVTVNAGTGISISVTGTNVKCFGDQDGTATVTGGNSSTSYLWSNGATSATITGLVAGTYSVTATDGNGCTDTGSTTITAPSSAVSASASVTQQVSAPGANDGAATVTASGGTPGYTYAWSNGRTTQSIGNLAPGSYSVTVTDSNGCTATSSVVLEEPCDPFTDPGTLKGKQTACGPGYDPTVLMEDIAPSGGSGAIEYLWMYSTTSPTFVGGTYQIYKNPDGSNATGATLDPAPVYVTTYFTRCVRREGCDWIEPTPICVIIEKPDLAQIQSDDRYCVNTPMTFTATDAGPGATYSWDFGPTGDPKTSDKRSVDVSFNGFQANPRVWLTVTLPDGCTGSISKKITRENPDDCPPSINFRTSVNSSNHVVAEWSSWMTGAECSFEVSKSHDGINFEPLFEMATRGEANEMNTFSFIDEQPKKGHSFYQVKATRLTDGEVAVSEPTTVRISWGADNSFVYPNPSADLFVVERFETFNSEGLIEIMNLKGQVLEVIYLAADEVRKEIPISDMNSGIYLVRVTYKDSITPEVHRFIKR